MARKESRQRTSFDLRTVTADTLDRLAEAAQRPRIDILERAVAAFEMLDEARREGAKILIQRGNTTIELKFI